MYTLRNVSKSYRTRQGTIDALRDVSLTIDDGDWIAIQGPTGGGKSTLLQLLGALDRPTAGEIDFGPDPVRLNSIGEAALSDVRAGSIGFVFQGFNLIPTLSAQDNVISALRPLGVRGSEAVERARDALAQVGLADRGDHLPAALSGGQQQRVAVARALVKNPTVILADEPTGNLDERMRDEIISLFGSVREENGVTLVVVTHDTQVAARADRVVTLDSGRILTGS